MQGASLVGRDVIVAGNKLSIDAESGVGQGGFELANAADAVKVEILSPSGAVVADLEPRRRGRRHAQLRLAGGRGDERERADVPRQRHDAAASRRRRRR